MINSAAIRLAITQVLTGTLGTVRTLDAGTFGANVFEGQGDASEKARALQVDHGFDVRLSGLRNDDASPVAAIGNYAIKRLDIVIEVTTATKTVVQETERDATLAALANSADDAIQALSFPGNVEETSAGAATGIISGLLLGPGGDGMPEWAEITQDWQAQIIRSRITASARVRVRQANFEDSEPLRIFGTSMRAWYRGDQYEDTVQTQNVSSWTDLSQHSASLTPPVSATQTLQIDFTTALGKTSAQSLGTDFSFDDYRVEGSAAFLGAGDAPNLLVVGRFTQVDAGVISRIGDAVDASSNVVFRAIKNASDNIAYQVDATTVATTTAADTSPHLFQFLNDGTSARVSIDDVAATVSAATPSNAAATRFGVPTTSSSNCAAFEYWEVLLLNGYPTAAQLMAYRQYAVDRYGLSITP